MVHPGMEAVEWVVAQGGLEGGAPIIVVILADSGLEDCLRRGLGQPALVVRVVEGASGGASGLSHFGSWRCVSGG